MISLHVCLRFLYVSRLAPKFSSQFTALTNYNSTQCFVITTLTRHRRPKLPISHRTSFILMNILALTARFYPVFAGILLLQFTQRLCKTVRTVCCSKFGSDNCCQTGSFVKMRPQEIGRNRNEFAPTQNSSTVSSLCCEDL